MRSIAASETKPAHILVIGDMMLDRYTYGVADRISPEAPVLVVKTLSREVRLGGAANVAANCRALGAQVTAIGIIGNDQEGATVQGLFRECGAQANLVVDSARCTTMKDRILGQSPHRTPQQILRIDTECTSLSQINEDRLLTAIEPALGTVQLVLISDYCKGVCGRRLLNAVLSTAKQRLIPVLIDPGRGVDWDWYRGASLIKPNRREATAAARLQIHTESDAEQAASLLSTRYEIPTVVLTLDQDGMLLHTQGLAARSYRGTTREVSDVTGAGDTVFAVLGVALAKGLGLDAAVVLAIRAAGLQVEKQGATTVTWEEIQACQRFEHIHSKVVSREWLAKRCSTLRQDGKRIAFTNGCFDLLHAGHVACLRAARSCADLLVVGLNSDASVRRLKGANRPINEMASRATLLAALECVDFVVAFEEDTPCELLRSLRPDVLVKGGDYTPDQVVGREIVLSYGGKVVVAGMVPGLSTTELLEKKTNLA